MQSVADTFAMDDALHHALPSAQDFTMDDAACAAAVAPLPAVPVPARYAISTTVFVRLTGDELFIRCELWTWREDVFSVIESTVSSFVTAVGSQPAVPHYVKRFDTFDVTEFSVCVRVRSDVSMDADALRENFLMLLRTFSRRPLFGLQGASK
jgi:hypothetical protein